MSNLFLINDYITNGFLIEYIDVIYLVSIMLGALTILSKNPIVSVLYLIGLFVNIAGLLVLIGCNFIGLAYILVYVGAVSILFLFILMLINIRVSELTSDTSNSIPLAIMVSFIFYYIVYNIIPYSVTEDQFYTIRKSFNLFSNNNELSFVTSKL